MIIAEYTFIEPAGTTVADTFDKMAECSPFRSERLLTAVELFVRGKLDSSHRLAPEGNAPADVEVFLVPPRHTLQRDTEAVVLLRVHHARETIEIVHLLENYGGIVELEQFANVKALALEAIEDV